MRRYRLSLPGLCETRWLQSRQVELASGSPYYTRDIQMTQHHTRRGWHSCFPQKPRGPINSRIITAKFQTTNKKINLHVVQCYAPTNDADNEVKELFYNQLYHTLESKKAKHIVILMGDMNAKIGGNNNSYELIMGREGLGTMNENGERFAVACADKTHTTQKRKSQIQHTALSGYRYLRTLPSHTIQPVPCTARSAKPRTP